MKKACLFLLAGIYAPQLSSFASHSDLIPFAVFAAAAGFIGGRFLLIACAVLGYSLFLAAAERVIDARVDSRYVGDSIVVDVRVADFPRQAGHTTSFVAEVSVNPWVPRRVRVSWFQPEHAVRFGDVWRLELRSRRPRGNSNPGGFDLEAWLFRERIAATAYVVAGDRNLLLRSSQLNRIDRLRQRIVDRLVQSELPAERAAVVAAITVGARHLLTAAQWDRYARTGTSHLMAISGLHVGMVAATGYALGLALSVLFLGRGNHHRLGIVAALGCALAYTALSGMAIPAMRAALMIGMVALANLARIPVRPFAVLAVAAAILAAWNPLTTMAPGYQLSFAAVAVLTWLAHRLPPVTGRGFISRSLLRLRQLTGMQFALLLGLAPLTVIAFDRVALAAPLVNLVAVPLFATVTVPCALVGVVLGGALQPVGDGLLWGATTSLGVVEVLIRHVADVPAAAATVASLDGWSRWWLLAPVVWIVLPPGWPCRGFGWLAAAAIVYWLPPGPVRGCAAVSVLDVGQGLAVVVETSETAMLYDAGPAYRGGGSAAESVVLPFLAHRGIRRLDQFVVSHSDLDHAGGAPAILNALPVDRVYAGEQFRGSARARACEAGDGWASGNIRFEFLHPPAAAVRDGNDASCVLQVSAGKYAVLLPGDIERDSEHALLRSGNLRPVTAVIAPHHGSATSSTPALVGALRPAVTVIPAGFGNRWSLPDAAVVGRWQARGSRVVSTGDEGAIRFTICERGGIGPISLQRTLQRRIWHE
jgi:competence protein ComEC